MKMQVLKNQVPGGWNNQVWKNQVRMAGMENASTNSADKVKHSNSPKVINSCHHFL